MLCDRVWLVWYASQRASDATGCHLLAPRVYFMHLNLVPIVYTHVFGPHSSHVKVKILSNSFAAVIGCVAMLNEWHTSCTYVFVRNKTEGRG